MTLNLKRCMNHCCIQSNKKTHPNKAVENGKAAWPSRGTRPKQGIREGRQRQHTDVDIQMWTWPEAKHTGLDKPWAKPRQGREDRAHGTHGPVEGPDEERADGVAAAIVASPFF